MTTPEVIYEVRDKKARENLKSLPFKLEEKMPDSKN